MIKLILNILEKKVVDPSITNMGEIRVLKKSHFAF
jgi:hypothetical protein